MNRHIHTQTMSAREFNQNRSRARQAADRGPLTITDRGKPAYVLMRYEDFARLRPAASLLSLEQKGGPEFDFDIELPERRIEPITDPFAADDEA